MGKNRKNLAFSFSQKETCVVKRDAFYTTIPEIIQNWKQRLIFGHFSCFCVIIVQMREMQLSLNFDGDSWNFTAIHVRFGKGCLGFSQSKVNSRNSFSIFRINTSLWQVQFIVLGFLMHGSEKLLRRPNASVKNYTRCVHLKTS
jgi:hypothetical protein